MFKLKRRSLILNNYVYHRHVKARRFVHALSQLPDDKWTATSKRRWMCARLGIYTPLLEVGWNGRSTKAGVAYAQALSAYGKLEEYQTVAKKLMGKANISRYQLELIRETAKYNLPIAVDLVNQIPVGRQTLYLKALKQSYEYQRNLQNNLMLSKDYSSTTLSPLLPQQTVLNTMEVDAKHPDLILLNSNILKLHTSSSVNHNLVALNHLNQYQTCFNLPKYKLVNPSAPFSSLNILLNCPIPHHPLSTKKLPKYSVSILTTMYNAEKFISTTLHSLLNQSWQNIEIILVNDASTDKSLSIATSIAKTDSRIKIVNLKENAGTYVAKNIGLKQATGEYIICHDADDWAHPLKIEHQIMPLLLDNRLKGSTSSWIKVEASGSYYARSAFPYLGKNPSSLMFRKRDACKLLSTQQSKTLWQPVRTGADSELYERFKLVFGVNSLFHVNKPLTIGAHHANSLMNATKTGTKQLEPRIRRLVYWETWRRQHINMVRQSKC